MTSQPSRPGSGRAPLVERAREANRAGRFRRAVELANTGLNARRGADAASLLLERARSRLELGELASAEADSRAARAAGAGGAALVLARCLFELERLQEARAAIAAALAEDAEKAAAWRLASRIHGKAGEQEQAVSCAETAWQRDPGEASLATLSAALGAAGRHEERVALLEHAPLAEAHAPSWVELGLSHYALGRSQAAIDAFHRALALEPESVEAHCGLAWVLLRVGRFEEGYRHQEHRQASAGLERRLGIAPLRPGTGAGARVLVCSEQGFGDTLQFARFMPRLRRRGASTTLLVAPPLRRLLESHSALGAIDARQPRFGSADYQTLLMSLPHVLQLGADLALDELPILRPEPERIAHWRARLPPGPKVALAWQGNPKYGGEPWRSMPFRFFAPLVERFRGRVCFISLQKHVGRDQLHAASFGHEVLDLGDEIDPSDAFVDSLAILTLVERFVATDSALAHVAGSAAIPAWILLSNVADWRWGCDEERTRWYPSLQLFRQPVAGDWGAVMTKLIEQLEAELGQRRDAAGPSRFSD